MIKFCESLTDEDLKKFVVPFMEASEAEKLAFEKDKELILKM